MDAKSWMVRTVYHLKYFYKKINSCFLNASYS